MIQSQQEIEALLRQLQDAEAKLSPEEKLKLTEELTAIIKSANEDLRKIRTDVDVAISEGKQRQDILRKISDN